MTEEMPAYPQPDGDTQAFWDSIAHGGLRLQLCLHCKRHVFYPRSVCPHCSSTDLDWVESSGRGRVYSFTVVHRAPPGFAGAPYVVALVDLDEDVRLMTRLVDVAPTDVTIGLEVELMIRGEPPLPYFVPSRSRRISSAS